MGKLKRGYYGVAVYHPKIRVNVGTLWRTANLFGGAFMATIGRRYKKQPSDTMDSPKHIPLYNYLTFDDFYNHLPHDCKLVGVELVDKAIDLYGFSHPERAVYLLGAEDHGIPTNVLERCHTVIKLRGTHSMNVSVAGSIVIYHREALNE